MTDMSAGARAYYAGGFRRTIGGVPCKVFSRRLTDGRYVNAKDSPFYNEAFDHPKSGRSRLADGLPEIAAPVEMIETPACQFHNLAFRDGIERPGMVTTFKPAPVGMTETVTASDDLGAKVSEFGGFAVQAPAVEIIEAAPAVEMSDSPIDIVAAADDIEPAAMGMIEPGYTITRARYSKGNLIIRCPSDDGYKTRAARLIGDGLNCRYVGRSNGYVASPAKVAKFEALYAAGFDACTFSRTIDHRELGLRDMGPATAMAALRANFRPSEHVGPISAPSPYPEPEIAAVGPEIEPVTASEPVGAPADAMEEAGDAIGQLIAGLVARIEALEAAAIKPDGETCTVTDSVTPGAEMANARPRPRARERIVRRYLAMRRERAAMRLAMAHMRDALNHEISTARRNEQDEYWRAEKAVAAAGWERMKRRRAVTRAMKMRAGRLAFAVMERQLTVERARTEELEFAISDLRGTIAAMEKARANEAARVQPLLDSKQARIVQLENSLIEMQSGGRIKMGVTFKPRPIHANGSSIHAMAN